MAELEVRVVSERREGLLVELGRVVTEYGHVLVRQRLVPDAQGACLTLILRGPRRGPCASRPIEGWVPPGARG